MLSDSPDEVLRVGRHPLLAQHLRDEQRPVRLPQRRHHIDRERLRVVRIIEEALHRVVSGLRQPHRRLHDAVGGPEQVVDPFPDVAQGYFGR